MDYPKSRGMRIGQLGLWIRYKKLFDYKIYAGDLYRFMKGEVEIYREATDQDYERYCELDTSPI